MFFSSLISLDVLELSLDTNQFTVSVEGRIQSAAKTVGAWLKPLLPALHLEIAEINDVLQALGLLVAGQTMTDDLPNPGVDTRWEKFLQLIKQYLRLGKEWVTDDRLIIFTEYKTTLDYLERRLRSQFKDADARVKVLYGGMEDREREAIKQAFNDPEDPIRILVATDAASEGLNLQETARLVLHYDIPWNPARLDQRNGRLDRHGQARDVIVFHFTSEDDADLRFLARVAEKVNTIREDLGSMEEVFDAAFQRRFVDFQGDREILANLDLAIANHKDRAKIPTQPTDTLNAIQDCEALKTALDLSPETLKSTLEVALGIGTSRQKLSLDDQGRFHLSVPIPKQWERLVDDYLRRNIGDTIQGALPAVVFDPQHFIHTQNHRPVFRAAKDTVLLHLGHPLFRQALALFARARFPGEQQRASRWLVRYGDIPAGMDGLLLLTVEELGVNDLRETFHHWVQTLRFALRDGELGELLEQVSPLGDQTMAAENNSEIIAEAQELWGDIERDVKKRVSQLTDELTQNLQTALANKYQDAAQEEENRFDARIKEVKKAMANNSIQKLEAEREALLRDMRQIKLFADDERAQAEKLKNLEEELNRRQRHYQGLLDFLIKEKERVLNKVLTQRYRMRGDAQIFPVTIEIRLPHPKN